MHGLGADEGAQWQLWPMGLAGWGCLQGCLWVPSECCSVVKGWEVQGSPTPPPALRPMFPCLAGCGWPCLSGLCGWEAGWLAVVLSVPEWLARFGVGPPLDPAQKFIQKHGGAPHTPGNKAGQSAHQALAQARHNNKSCTTPRQQAGAGHRGGSASCSSCAQGGPGVGSSLWPQLC